jgi:hypothetical protein
MRYIFLILFSTYLSNIYADPWLKQEIGNGITVNFPTKPTYTLKQLESTHSGMYGAATSNCVFLVMVVYNCFPNLSEYMKANSVEQTKLKNTLLDAYINGRLKYNNSNGNIKSCYIDGYLGRQVEYHAINPKTGEMGLRTTKAIVINNKIISFDCWLLNESQEAINETSKFYTSIKAQSKIQTPNVQSRSHNYKTRQDKYEFIYDKIFAIGKLKSETINGNGKIVFLKTEVQTWHGNQCERFFINDVNKSDGKLQINTTNNKNQSALFTLYSKHNKSYINADINTVEIKFNVINGSTEELNMYEQ